MKIHPTYYLILAVLVVKQVLANGLDADDWGAVTNNLQMSIKLEDKETHLKAGQPYSLLIRYKNVSTNEPLDIYVVNGTVDDPSYSFVVISPSGKDVSPDMKKVQRAFSGADHLVAPGHIDEVKLNLNKYCSLDEVGTYKIIAKKTIWTYVNKHFEAVSNPLNVTVIPNR
jgi:hypothetical protein